MSSNIRAYTCHYRFGWGWYYSHFVDDDANGQISLLRVAGTADGGEFAVWYKITSDGNRIYANRLANQNPYAVWETPQALTDSITVFDIALSVDALGNAIVIWVQPDFPHNRLFTRRYTPGLGWDTVQLIDNNTGHCELPRIAMDASGNAIVVWQLQSVFTGVYANYFSTVTGWGTPQLISATDANAYSPNIAMNNAGTAMAVWQQDDNGIYNAYARYFVPTVGWETAQLIESGSSNAYSIQLDIDDSGSVVAAWRQPDIYFNRFTPDSGWSSEEMIAQGFVDGPFIATNSKGQTILTWNQRDYPSPTPGDALVYARKFDPMTGWETAKNLMSESGNANPPKAAIDSEGNATVIWSQSVASNTSGTASAVFTYSY